MKYVKYTVHITQDMVFKYLHELIILFKICVNQIGIDILAIITCKLPVFLDGYLGDKYISWVLKISLIMSIVMVASLTDANQSFRLQNTIN